METVPNENDCDEVFILKHNFLNLYFITFQGRIHVTSSPKQYRRCQEGLGGPLRPPASDPRRVPGGGGAGATG